MKINNKWNQEKPKRKTKEELKKQLEKDDTITDYKFVRNEKGELKIKKTGTHSLQEIIDSHKNEAGLENILKKYHMLGSKINTNLLSTLPEFNKKNLTYGDDRLIEKDNINKQKIEKIIKENNEKIETLKKQMESLQKENQTKTAEVKETTTNGK